jgi:tripartite-type tricarboxylate transporter receptor subunit TctC
MQRIPNAPFSGEHPRRRFLSLAAGAAALPAVSRVAWAQADPSRPVTVIVPLAAGGLNDTLARILAERMRRPLGQPVIVENVSGADGSIGLGRTARARPDGYTIDLAGSSSRFFRRCFGISLNRNAPRLRDFTAG